VLVLATGAAVAGFALTSEHRTRTPVPFSAFRFPATVDGLPSSGDEVTLRADADTPGFPAGATTLNLSYGSMTMRMFMVSVGVGHQTLPGMINAGDGSCEMAVRGNDQIAVDYCVVHNSAGLTVVVSEMTSGAILGPGQMVAVADEFAYR
jgi:hypothetical protein